MSTACLPKYILSIAAVTVVIGFAGAAVAQESGDRSDAVESVEITTQNMQLTVGDALQRSKRYNQQIRQGRASLERSQLSVLEARAGRLPNISAEARYMNNLATPVIVLPPGSPFGDVLRTGVRHNFNASIQGSIPIYNAQLNRGIALSRAAESLEKALFDATLFDVQIEVFRAYISGLMAFQAQRVLQQSHETLQANLRYTESMHEEGLVPEYDMIRMEVQVRNMEPELLRANNNYEGALNYLKLLVGIPVQQPIELVDDLETIFDSLSSHTYEADFTNNNQIQQLEEQYEVANRQISLERAAYMPSLALIGNYNYQGQGEDLGIFDYSWTSSSAIGLLLSVPIFSGGRRQRVERAKVEQMQLVMQQEFLRESLQSQYDLITRRIEQLSETLAAQKRNIEQAERGYEIATISYEEGVRSLIDINDAEAALRDARLNYHTTLIDSVNAILDLNELVGRHHFEGVGGVE